MKTVNDVTGGIMTLEEAKLFAKQHGPKSPFWDSPRGQEALLTLADELGYDLPEQTLKSQLIPQDVLADMNNEELLETMRSIEPHTGWYISRAQDRDSEVDQMYFIHEGMCITDPFLSDCGRFTRDPVKDYGLSQEGALTLGMINGILEERAK